MSCIWMINESPLTDDASIFEGRFGLGAAVGPDMTNGGLEPFACKFSATRRMSGSKSTCASAITSVFHELWKY
jgi:hypothetical protein